MLMYSLRTLALARGRRPEPHALRAMQERRFRALLRRAVAGSPFYREKYRGLDVDRVAPEDLPPTDKAELMADFDRTVTDRAITREGLRRFLEDPANLLEYYLGKYVACHTSGSQGQPMLLVQDRRSVDLFFGMQMSRGNTDPVTLKQAIHRLRHPKRLAVVTLKQGLYPSAALFQHVPAHARRYIDLMWVSQTDGDMVERLNAFRPQAIAAYAGVLEILALEVEAGRLRVGPELTQLVSNSEVLTDSAKARIEAAFGRHVMNNYATGECPFLSNGCPADDGAHVNADWCLFEVVDDAYRPVPAGTPGSRVLVTNLANHVQPIIRYEVGDVVTMAEEPCRCGSLLPRIARIGGRATDVFWVGQGARRRQLVNLVLSHALEYFLDVREWQAVQTDPERLLIRLEPLPGRVVDVAATRPFAERELALHGFDDVRLDFEVVPRLEVDPTSGKFRRMVSRIGGMEPVQARHLDVTIDREALARR
jgi:phenylacetate-coenzyme A ligase PaaK-like adenylate-forming protein